MANQSVQSVLQLTKKFSIVKNVFKIYKPKYFSQPGLKSVRVNLMQPGPGMILKFKPGMILKFKPGPGVN